MSAKTTLTPELITAVAHGIRGGKFLSTVAAELGVSESTLRKQLSRGNSELDEGKESIFVDLAIAVALAEGELKERWVAYLEQDTATGDKDRPSIRWLMEKRFPKEFGSRATVDINANVKTETPSEALQKVLKMLAPDPTSPEDGETK